MHLVHLRSTPSQSRRPPQCTDNFFYKSCDFGADSNWHLSHHSHLATHWAAELDCFKWGQARRRKVNDNEQDMKLYPPPLKPEVSKKRHP